MLPPRLPLILALVSLSGICTLGLEEIDICDLSNQLMFCNCGPVSRNESAITCFIHNRLDADDELWSAFGSVDEAVVALTLTSRPNFAHLDFLPVTAFRSLPHLQTVTVQEAKLGPLKSGSLSKMSALTTLMLERNDITSLQPYSIAYLPKLKKLILSENVLNEILADCLVDLWELKELYLDRNNISRVETCAFCSLHNLRELELWGNTLTDLTEGMFRGLRYLKRIDLYRNQLRIINSKVFQGMPRLEEIDLKDNVIEYISPWAFNELPNLMLVMLNNNRLKTLYGTTFKSPKKLMTIDVSSNLLETVQEEVIKNMANAKDNFFTFRFRDNYLQCGCDLQWVPSYMKTVQSTTLIRELRHAKCQTANGTWVEVHKLAFADCPVATEPPTTTTTVSVTQPASSTMVSPKMEPYENDDESNTNAGCTVTVYLGLYCLVLLTSVLHCY